MHAECSRERSIYIRVELAKSVGHRRIFFAARSKNKVCGLCNESTKDRRGDQRTGKLLVDAQKKWQGFRDAECALQTVRTAGGSIQSMTVASCLAALTEGRAKDFENLLSCSPAAGEQERAMCAIPRDADGN
ncbi:hypothetical protein VPARA_52450 [Variovorax paradoxus]|uniref:Lysozyme inhibitor LprI-like N-terminal domain-containing protein n=2 Tax=Variovorax paradoxus TaxID=34073 RepID=A0A0H2LTP0_VARPD|nr:hypothetical protein VPARA_52450 [Variovorax paradoxus]